MTPLARLLMHAGRAAAHSCARGHAHPLLLLLLGFLAGLGSRRLLWGAHSAPSSVSHSSDAALSSASGALSTLDVAWPSGDQPLRHWPGVTTLVCDLRLRNAGGAVADDPPLTQRHLLALAVGAPQLREVDALVSRFPRRDFSVVLFHYDGNGSAWDALPWARDAIHVSALRQTKWWFAKRFLTPPVVARYRSIWLWDEDLSLSSGFDPLRFAAVLETHRLAIAQPGIVGAVSWDVTRRRPGEVLHRDASSGCDDVDAAAAASPPCSAFVEVQAPVIAASVWPCVWALIPEDLVHAFGLDFSWGEACAEGFLGQTARESMAVIDQDFVAHLALPTILGNSTRSRRVVHARRMDEWRIWKERWAARTLSANR